MSMSKKMDNVQLHHFLRVIAYDRHVFNLRRRMMMMIIISPTHSFLQPMNRLRPSFQLTRLSLMLTTQVRSSKRSQRRDQRKCVVRKFLFFTLYLFILYNNYCESESDP